MVFDNIRYSISSVIRRQSRRKRSQQQKKPKKLRKSRPKHRADKPPQGGKNLLLALPTEIRLRILEYALCRDEPIQARENYRSSLPYGSSYYDYDYDSDVDFDLWPRGAPNLGVLQTCRQLNEEGVEVFYKKNTFGISVYDPGWGSYDNADLLGFGDVETAFDALPRLKDSQNIKITFYLADSVYCNGLSSSSSKISIDDPIQKLQQCWKQRGNLQVQVTQRGRQWVDNPLGAGAMFHKLGLLRCKNVTFQGVPGSLSFRLKTLIESDKPVTDLQTSFLELYTYLEGMHLHYDSGLSETFGESYDAVEKAAIEFDEEEFIKYRKEVIETAMKRLHARTASLQIQGSQLQEKEIAVVTDEEEPEDDQSDSSEDEHTANNDNTTDDTTNDTNNNDTTTVNADAAVAVTGSGD